MSKRMNMNEGRGIKYERSDDHYPTTEERAPKVSFSQNIKTNKNREPKRSPSQDLVAICATTQDKKAIEAPARTRVYARGKKTARYYLPFETLSTANAANQMWNKHYQETVAYQPRRITSKCRLMESERRYYDFRFIDKWEFIRKHRCASSRCPDVYVPESWITYDDVIPTERQREDAKWVMQYYRSLGNPGIGNLKGAIRSGLFRCHITINDIINTEMIFGDNWNPQAPSEFWPDDDDARPANHVAEA